MKASLMASGWKTPYRLIIAGLAGTAILAGSAGLFAPPPVSQPWAAPTVPDIPAVAAQAWSDNSVSTPPSNYPTSTGASVSGTEPAVVTRPFTSTTIAASGLFGGLRPLAAPPAANDKGTGDFSATPGVSSGSWGGGSQTGGFTWNYPLTVRQAPAGPSPSLGFSYDSSRIDGLTSATNNQASVVGDGWGLGGAGSIRQTFATCADQGITGSYDLCGSPAGQTLTVSFGGRSGQLIKDAASGIYKLQNDDNTKVEYLSVAGVNGTYDGGHWRLTDTDGTQYYFGLNKLPGWVAGKATTNSVDTVTVGAAKNTQPCWNASFAASLCNQAYAWNLDYVVDLHGNSEAFYYTQDTNNYKAQAGSGAVKNYVRASRLIKVDYGMRSGRELLDTAPLHVVFDYAPRCTGTNCATVDVPSNFNCAASPLCSAYSPTFYTDQMLTKVRAETLVAGVYTGADSWNLKHSYPNPGDGSKPALWLGSIDHQGVDPKAATAGTISDPATVFSGQTLQNRVWVVDGLAPLDRYRISAIKTVTGASIAVTYTAAECTPTNLPASPQSNTKRCFPQWWAPTTPIAQPARMDYFHIYPVASVSSSPGPGADGSTQLVTKYQYLGTPAYKYAAAKYVPGSGGSQLSWSVFAGYGQVKTIIGNELNNANPSSVTTYLRGLDGTPADTTGALKDVKVTVSNGSAIDDSPWLAGLSVESQNFLGTGSTVLSSSISLPWASAPTATGSQATNAAQARHIAVGTTIAKKASGQGGSGWLESKTTNSFDSYGRISATSSTGNTAVSGDESCSVTTFADNTTKNILGLTAVSSSYANECSNGAPNGDLLKSSRNLYDGNSSAVPGSSGYTAPTKGEATRTDQAKSVSGNSAGDWQQGATTSYDALGRPTTSTDNNTGTARTTSIAYTPSAGLPTSISATNPLGWVTSVSLDPVRGKTLTQTDENGNSSTFRYDASGRPTAMWDPLRPIASNPDPSVATSYSVSQSAPSWVKSVKQNSTKVTSFAIYDGLGRLRQTQAQSPGGGTIATDTMYNSLGSVRFERNKYYLSAEPNGTLQIPTAAVPSATEYAYDAAGRPTKLTALKWDNQVLWSTQLSYAGNDTVTATGPGAQAAQTVVKDFNGSVIKRLQYHGTTASGTVDTTSYTFDRFKALIGMKDAAGNQWSWNYDPLGRQTLAKDPDSGDTTTSYDNAGRVATVTDALGAVTSVDYDQLDRPTAVKIAAAGGTAKTISSSVYDGEKKGQLTSSTRFNGPDFDQPVKTSYSSYTADYQPRSVTTEFPQALGAFAGSHQILGSYTPTGKLAQQKTPAFGGMAEELLGFGYDDWDHPTSVSDGPGNTIAGNTQYDHLGNIKIYSQYDLGYVYGKPDSIGNTDNLYNWDATTGRLESQWANNNLNGTLTDLGKVSYTYNEAGQLTARETAFAARSGSPNDFQCYSYDYAGHLGAVWTPASKACSSAPTSASTSVAGLGGVAPYAQTYSYNLAGDRSQVKRFDAAGALAVTEDYSYPAAGSPGVHRLQSVKSTSSAGQSTASFGWDAAGRMTNRAGQTLGYTLDGLLSSSSGVSSVSANPNPNSSGGTPPAPTTGSGAENGNRYYDADGNLVGIVDGSGTTAILGNITAHATPPGIKTATKTYTFAGKTVGQRVTSAGVTKLSFLIGDSVNTSQTILNQGVGMGPANVVTRFTDPYGLARSASRTGTGNAAFVAAAPGLLGKGSNAGNPGGFGAVNGYISGLADTGSDLTHLGARDLDPVLGVFTSPDPVLKTNTPNQFGPYTYAEGDPVNGSDPSGLLLSSSRNMYDGGGRGTATGSMSEVVGAVFGFILTSFTPVEVNKAPAAAGSSRGIYSPDHGFNSSAAYTYCNGAGSGTAGCAPFYLPGQSASFGGPGGSASPHGNQLPAAPYYGNGGGSGGYGGSGWGYSSVGAPANTAATAAAAAAAHTAMLQVQNAQMHAASEAATQKIGKENQAEAATSTGGGSGANQPPAKTGFADAGDDDEEGLSDGARIIQRLARDIAGKGADWLNSRMTQRMRRAADILEWLRPLFKGTTVHNEVSAELNQLFPGRFAYSTNGPDFFDLATGEYIELTTPGSVASHLLRPGYSGVTVVTYTLP
ncbi:RHS repeat domain-containing protein [Psychromicrobium lacuslunae]|uniref:Uncharacterized protein n=1 Tax=Psychromicrobium lacuslunae TaxID=1618207 RepID=A0A0D4BXP5_9MICC|nr:RHS repeat-associated core domain-containing protein [Psychromicrobium lacuslunae]AJT40905.1 hypothetical protein UM93_04155 [Psychromicrobium lacuslunae]